MTAVTVAGVALERTDSGTDSETDDDGSITARATITTPTTWTESGLGVSQYDGADDSSGSGSGTDSETDSESDNERASFTVRAIVTTTTTTITTTTTTTTITTTTTAASAANNIMAKCGGVSDSDRYVVYGSLRNSKNIAHRWLSDKEARR